MNHRYSLALLLVLAGCALTRSTAVDIQPSVRTDPMSDDPDDPAIWVHPTDPARSLIIGTNKVKAPKGALVVFAVPAKLVRTDDAKTSPGPAR